MNAINISTQGEMLFKVMRLIKTNLDLTQCEIAKELSLSERSIKYRLKVPIENSLVIIEKFNHSKNKFGFVDFLTLVDINEELIITHFFLRKKIDEYEALGAEIERLRPEVGEDEADDP